MTVDAHLWAIRYDDTDRADQVRREVARLAETHCLNLLDTAVAVRYPDGCATLDGEPFVAAAKLGGHTFADFLAALALGAPPLTGAAAGTLVRGAGGTAAEVGIDDGFVSEVEALMKPGTSALFVLDREDNLDAILQGIRGLGGTVLRTNVDARRSKLIQLTLAAAETREENRP
jgi:uncharacterized membrane protein